MKDRMKRVIEVTTWLEQETANQVVTELRKLVKQLTKSETIIDDMRDFMRRYYGKKR